MTTYYIYGLLDPTTKEIRYVGCTKIPQFRFHQHLTYGRRRHYKMCTGEWIADLLLEGLRPELVILEEYTASHKDHAREVEKQWIHYYIDKGAQLLNRNKAKVLRRSSKILPDREPKVEWSKERGWYYTFDY